MNILDTISLGKIVQIREHLLQQQAKGKKVYRLESGDPSFSIPEYVATAIEKALKEGKTHYISNNGIPELRRALAEKLCVQNKIPSTEEDVFVSNGAMHALYLVFRCLLEEQDEVIVPEPLWTEIGENIRLAGGQLVSVPLVKEQGYQYLVENIEKKITSKTKAIFINSPHNPTGVVIPKQELIRIAELAVSKNLFLIHDEAYEDLSYETQHFSVASAFPMYDKNISIYSFSKSYAMSGLRLGYIVSKNQLLKDRIPKLLRCTVNGINSIAQWGALAAVQGTKDSIATMVKEYIYRRNTMYDNLIQVNGLNPFKPQGAFYMWCEVSDALLNRLHLNSVEQLSDFLANQGVGSAPGRSFGLSCANAIRFSFSCSTAMVEAGSKEAVKILNTEL